MFEILQPNKKEVGNRLKYIKNELNISFTELGNRLGLKKSTISSYFQGYNLAPIDIIEKISKISNKPIGWFYFGEIEDYILSYLKLKENSKLLEDYPNIPQEIKQIFFSNEFKNIGWENDFGYPCEDFIDDCFLEIKNTIIKKYVKQIVKAELSNLNINNKEKKEIEILISTEIINSINTLHNINYGEDSKIISFTNQYLKNLNTKKKLEFDNNYLIGNLINILDNNKETENLINNMSLLLTSKNFSTFFGGNELIEIFQSMRPALIKLYTEKSNYDFYEWFEK